MLEVMLALFALMMAAWLVGLVAHEVRHRRRLRRPAEAREPVWLEPARPLRLRRRRISGADVDELIKRREVQDREQWIHQFPDWKNYVLDRLPSDQWPVPTRYGPQPRPLLPGDPGTKTITLFSMGGEVRREVVLPDLWGKLSPQGHALEYCACTACLHLRAEYWGRKALG